MIEWSYRVLSGTDNFLLFSKTVKDQVSFSLMYL